MLSDIGFRLMEDKTSHRGAVGKITPKSQSGHHIGSELGNFLMKQGCRHTAENRRHGNGLKQRPAHTQRRTAVFRPQVHAHQRHPEKACPPDFANIVTHDVSIFGVARQQG